jgi:hypothetical protein
MRTFTFAFSFLLASFALPLAAQAADDATVHAILITASKEKAPADKRLAPYEATLQRNLPESSFSFVAEGTASFSGKGTKSISLGSGHRIDLETGTKEADGIFVKVRWLNGRTVVIENAFTFQPGGSKTVVLGQRPSGDGNLPMVILIAK